MFKTYLKYFFFYIISAKNRQRLLFLAVTGLFLSSFALIVLQSTMGGLQNSLMERSKAILGKATLYYKAQEKDENYKTLFKILNEKKIKYSKEYEIEVLLRYQTFMTPVIVHGLDEKSYIPEILKIPTNHEYGEKYDAIMPLDLAYKIGVAPPEKMQIISPAHVDELMGEIPRTQSISIGGTISTDVPEIDLYHIWVRLPLIQNLIQNKMLNRIRIYSDTDFLKLKSLIPETIKLKTWEEENSTLVWALNLENHVMLFLFVGMTLLVSLSISSGLLIFFNKIKSDLASFWILGSSFSQINRATRYFLHLMSFFSIFSGIILGVLFLWVFDHYALEIMPDVFVDRRIPILITAKGLFVSFFVPFLISSIFVNFALAQFKRDHDFLNHIRSIS